MRRNLETLKYSTMAPSRYVVHLHPAEFARLEGIIRSCRSKTIARADRGTREAQQPSGAAASIAGAATAMAGNRRVQRPTGNGTSNSCGPGRRDG